MATVVKGDDVSGTKDKARLQVVTGGTGVNGLMKKIQSCQIDFQENH